MSAKTKLIEILEGFGYPCFLQGTLEEDAPYPDSFITFQTTDSSDNSFYDDELFAEDWSFAVIFYSNNPELIETEPPKIIKELKKNKYLPQGKGFDIPSDEPTHTGWVLNFIYKEYEGEMTNGN